MSKTLNRSLALIAAFSALSVVSVDAAAATIRVKCETRAGRSSGSVDGQNLASGNYSAVFSSGSNTAQSPVEHTVGDEVEFDFDSNKRDIKQGATPIAKDFIVGGTATGSLLDAGGKVVATKTVTCRAR
ncbi:hypothetical protein AACH06_07755 [Ideonella sp. DXS29W]|uniref:Uncharacterized protein n=1 Tax=Ideonella lacteola TaxID=2984193 RepID=A0ABU9BL72_9BURK